MANKWANMFGPAGKALADTLGKGPNRDPYGTLNPEQN